MQQTGLHLRRQSALIGSDIIPYTIFDVAAAQASKAAAAAAASRPHFAASDEPLKFLNRPMCARHAAIIGMCGRQNAIRKGGVQMLFQLPPLPGLVDRMARKSEFKC